MTRAAAMLPKHGDCLCSLAWRTAPRGEMCVGFDPICRDTDLPRNEVRRIIRHLARKGLAEFHRGLCNEDGEFAGAGYCITKAGQELAEKIDPVIDRDRRKLAA
jgi:transcription initiation factor IIE alpha subunit